ncbi:MAG: cytidylate kinase family protein [Lachnospiraceae bacterium]|nr:cytidylate kinase family protein [Lachnospiraceae bacterium]
MHITLTGNLGSGKSTICRLMSGQYGYEVYSTGKIMRELAAERGLTVLEMNRLMETDHSFDNIIDETVTKISKEASENLFFDSRLAWHFAVNSFKVFLSVDINEAARRVFNDCRGDVETYKDLPDAKSQLIERAHAEDLRYKDIYGIDYFNPANYNLILDSTFTSPKILAEMIQMEKQHYESLVSMNKTPDKPRILLSPNRLCGMKCGNTRDNSDVYESHAVVRMKIETFEVVSGKDEINDAAVSGYEFISVTDGSTIKE